MKQKKSNGQSQGAQRENRSKIILLKVNSFAKFKSLYFSIAVFQVIYFNI